MLTASHSWEATVDCLRILEINMVRVVVVGAGVIGLSAALHLLERFPGQLDLTVVAEKFSPQTTSDKSGAIAIGCHSAYNAIMQNWNRATLRRFRSIYGSEENARVQICLESGYNFLQSKLPDPWYKNDVFGFRHVAVDSEEAKAINVPPNCVDIWSFSTYNLDPKIYLKWLMEKIREKGATFEQRKVSSLDELSNYDIIVNCTGLGSYDLLEDTSMSPVRGQLVLVEAPWIKHWLNYPGTENRFHVFPRAHNVVLGGTATMGDWSETTDIETAESILKTCQEHFPSLHGAKVIGGWAGLRPFRSSVRLESCAGHSGSLVVHCYGHGGHGMILSWGCAEDIGDIVQERIGL